MKKEKKRKCGEIFMSELLKASTNSTHTLMDVKTHAHTSLVTVSVCVTTIVVVIMLFPRVLTEAVSKPIITDKRLISMLLSASFPLMCDVAQWNH